MRLVEQGKLKIRGTGQFKKFVTNLELFGEDANTDLTGETSEPGLGACIDDASQQQEE